MAMIVIVTILCLCCLIGSCQTRTSTSQNTTVQDSITEIMDPLSSTAGYEIKRDNFYSLLPDSLGGDKVIGLAALTIVIDDNSNVIEIRIMKLSIQSKSENRSIVEYHNGINKNDEKFIYPTNVERYYSFLKEYVSTLNIVKTGIPEKRNEFNLVIRFK